jgi:hypothetical protein
MLERVKGIEPSSQPWEGHILPLNHTRLLAALTFIKPTAGWQLVCKRLSRRRHKTADRFA